MDSVIKRIADIEKTAEDVVNHAEEQKREIEEIYRAEREEFDQAIAAKTEEKLKKIREEAESKRNQLMEDEKNRQQAVIEGLEKEYEENHEAYAQEILKRIISA